MIILVNGPGIPVLDHRSGWRIPAPEYGKTELDAFHSAASVIVVEPFSTLTPEPFLSEFEKWIPVPGTGVLVLSRTQNQGLEKAYEGYKEIPVLASVSDISILNRSMGKYPVTRRLVWVNKGQDKAWQELKRIQPWLIGFGDGCDIPRLGPGLPIYWIMDGDDDIPEPGPVLATPEFETVAMINKDKVEACIFGLEHGGYRIEGLTSKIPDPGLVLKNSVLRATSDPEFARLAEAGFRELSVSGIKGMR